MRTCARKVFEEVHHNLGNAIMAMKALVWQLEKHMDCLDEDEVTEMLNGLYKEIMRIECARTLCYKGRKCDG